MKNRRIRCVTYTLTPYIIYLRSPFATTTIIIVVIIIIIATIIGAASTPRGYRDKIVTLLLIRREGESPQEVACKFSSKRTWVRSMLRCVHALVARVYCSPPRTPPFSFPVTQALFAPMIFESTTVFMKSRHSSPWTMRVR